MIDLKLLVNVVLMLVLFQWAALGQDFTSGSTGADGDLIFDINNGAIQEFDHLANGHNGIWNFNTITIPSGITVTFPMPYSSATPPVIWLATGDVTIDGILHLNGGTGQENATTPGQEAKGGPGGFAGSLGGGDGYGPGAGEGKNGWTQGNLASFGGVYGNRFLQPLIGGSGGGGVVSGNGRRLGSGGGGGAILISSSGTIDISGEIRCNGGGGRHLQNGCCQSATSAGGSGGGIRLIGTKISGTGSISASPRGRIAIESFDVTQFNVSANPLTYYLNVQPTTTFSTSLGTVRITDIDGNGVSAPALGRTANPDVFFAESGPVIISLECSNIPLGETLTVTVKSTATNTASVSGLSTPLTGTIGMSTASIELTVPAGRGVITAHASWTP